MLSSQVITDEEELHKMSMECEPPSGGLPPPPPLSTVLLTSLPNITPQIILNTTLLHLYFSLFRPASETHRPPPPRWARPPRRPRTTPPGRTRTSPLGRSSPSSQKRSIDCRSRSLLPHQISLVRLVDFVLSSTPLRIPISVTNWQICQWPIVLKGAASPQAVKKLLSLSEQSRTKVQIIISQPQWWNSLTLQSIWTSGGDERARLGLVPIKRLVELYEPPEAEGLVRLLGEGLHWGARPCFPSNFSSHSHITSSTPSRHCCLEVKRHLVAGKPDLRVEQCVRQRQGEWAGQSQVKLNSTTAFQQQLKTAKTTAN